MEAIRELVNFLSYPQWSFTLSLVGFGAIFWSRRPWSKTGGWLMLAAGTLFFCLSLLDPNFSKIVSKADNVPIVMMVFIVGFFVWLSMHKALKNDRRLDSGEPTFEKSESEDRIFTWPDLVFSEFICMVLLSVGMVLWSTHGYN